jgi:hypothetical protein
LVVPVVVDANGAITIPGTLVAGAYEFRVTSSALASVTLLQAQGGYTATQLVADLGPHADDTSEAAAAGRFDSGVRAFGGARSVPGSPGVFSVAIVNGTYWVVDLAREPIAGNVSTVVVTGSLVAGSLPAPDAVATADADRSWTVPSNLKASGTLLVRNPVDRTHQLVLDPVPTGVAPEAYLSSTQLGRGAPPLGTLPGPSLISLGVECLWTYDLPAGAYVVMDLSLDESGYRQYAGAGAVLVTLT